MKESFENLNPVFDDSIFTEKMQPEITKAAIIEHLDEQYESNLECTATGLLLRPLEVIPYLCEQLFQKTGLAALVGSSDSGKSAFLRQLALSVAADFFEFLEFRIESKHKSVIYYSTEDDENSLRYLLNKQYQGLRNQRNIEDFEGLRFIFNSDNPLIELDRRLTQKPADLVIIDAFSDIYDKSMNENTQVRSFLNEYSKLAQKHNCLILFLHHIGKRTESMVPDKSNVIGSQAFEAKMRLLIELRTDPIVPHLKHLCVLKGNYLPVHCKRDSFELKFDENMLFSRTGNRVPFDKLVKNQSSSENSERQEKIHEAKELRAEGKTVEETAEMLGVSKGTISKWLRKHQ